MIVLAIDTCLAACQAVVARDGRILAEASEAMARGHQERLAEMVRDVVCASGLRLGAVERIGVTVGPGSFTGLRVGLAFAKGLAMALGRPCVGVGTLEALAASRPGGRRYAVIDAGRGHVFLQAFDGEGALMAPDNLPLALALARVAELGPGAMIGPGAILLAGPGEAACPIAAPALAAIARLALAAAPSGPTRPLYLRAPDARLPAIPPA